MESNRLYLSTMFLGAAVMGGTALFAKLIELNVSSIIFWRSVVAAGIVFIFYRLNKKRSPFFENRKATLMIYLSGLALGAHWLTYFQSIQISTVAIGAISMHTYPIFTVFLEPLIHKAKLHGRDMVLALAVFIGCFVLALAPDDTGAAVAGVLWGVLSAALFAGRNVVSRYYVSDMGALKVMLVQLLGVLTIVASLSGLIGGIETSIDTEKIYLLVLLGIFFTALPHSLVVFSLKGLSAKTASIIGCLQPIFATIFAFLILGEVPGLNVYVGGLIITVAIIVELKMLSIASKNQ